MILRDSRDRVVPANLHRQSECGASWVNNAARQEREQKFQVYYDKAFPWSGDGMDGALPQCRAPTGKLIVRSRMEDYGLIVRRLSRLGGWISRHHDRFSFLS